MITGLWPMGERGVFPHEERGASCTHWPVKISVLVCDGVLWCCCAQIADQHVLISGKTPARGSHRISGSDMTKGAGPLVRGPSRPGFVERAQGWAKRSVRPAESV
jgi:hypothetical protein